MKSTLLGELEQTIMNIIWDSKEPLRPSDVSDRLRKEYAYSTVVTILTRLYQKGILSRVKHGKVYQYYAKKSREEYANSRLKKLFKGLINNYGELAISQFVDSIGNNPEDLKNLRAYLDNRSDGKK